MSIKTNLAPFAAGTPEDERRRTTQPIVTGTSVLAVAFQDGVVMLADTLGSYGRMSRFRNFQRLRAFGGRVLVGASGDLGDFQAIADLLERRRVADVCADDGAAADAKETLSFLSRVMYQRRNKMNPLWNDLVVAGEVDGERGLVLGAVDKLGNAYRESFVATGFGAHLALPLMRERWRADMKESEAVKLLEDCARVLYYRDCRTVNKMQRATVTRDAEDGTVRVRVSEPYVLETQWSFQSFVNPKAGGDTGGSW